MSTASRLVVPSTSKSVPTYSFLAILAPPSVRNAPVSPLASEESVVSVISTTPATVAAPANVADKSSLSVRAVAKEFNELPEPPALAVWNIISAPAPLPFLAHLEG